MFTRVEVRNFRSLRAIDLQLSNFHVLTGPNGTGKTTLLDVFGFLADLMNNGLGAAIEKRTNNFYDLTFGGNGEPIQIAFEAQVPEHLAASGRKHIRYQFEIKPASDESGIGIYEESLILFEQEAHSTTIQFLPTQNGIDHNDHLLGRMGILTLQKAGDILEIKSETDATSFRFNIGFSRLGLANLMPDDFLWPISNWFRELVRDSIRPIMLDSYILRQASPYAKKGTFTPDGAQLPWLIEELKVNSPLLYDQWIAHVRTAIPDLKSVKTILREDDRHRYLKLVYDNGIECPSWTASDGTLRLLALTLIAFMEKFEGVYLIEEPENGIHPLAIETIYGALSNMNDAQILLATHSPVVVSLVHPKDLLCFSKTEDGITNVIGGLDHPRLAEWKGELNLSLLFAAGILD